VAAEAKERVIDAGKYVVILSSAPDKNNKMTVTAKWNNGDGRTDDLRVLGPGNNRPARNGGLLPKSGQALRTLFIGPHGLSLTAILHLKGKCARLERKIRPASTKTPDRLQACRGRQGYVLSRVSSLAGDRDPVACAFFRRPCFQTGP
jgi:hypothetical protein